MTARIKDRTARRQLRGLPAVLTAVTAVLLLVGTGAGAAPSQPQQLPPGFPQPPAVGDTMEMEVLAALMPIVFVGSPGPGAVEQSVSTGPMKGAVAFEVMAADPLDPWSLTLKMTEFSMTTTDPAAPPALAVTEQGTPDLGKVTIEMSDTTPTPDSTVTMTSQSPPTFEHTMVLNFSLTIEDPPPHLHAQTGDEQGSDSLTLITQEPVSLSGQLSGFPPQGEPYVSIGAINTALPNDPNLTIATIEKISLKIGGV